MVITLLVTLMILPVEVAFNADFLARDSGNNTATEFDTSSSTHILWSVVNYAVDALFLLDLLLNFKTGFVHPATEEVCMYITASHFECLNNFTGVFRICIC